MGSVILSADSTKVFFTADNGSGTALYSVRTDGTSLVKLDDAIDATINPAGTILYYTKIDGTGFAQIYSYNLATSTSTALTTSNNDKIAPSVSGDGATVAFSWPGNGSGINLNLWKIAATGGTASAVTSFSTDDVTASSFSPTTAQIAFVLGSAANVGDVGLYIINTNGAAQTKIVAQPLIDSSVTWYSTTRGLGATNRVAGKSYGYASYLKRRGRSR